MKDVAKMRLGLLPEIRKLIRFFEDMEKRVKSRDPASIYPAYVFISTLAYHMREGDLSPLDRELKQALLHDDHMRREQEEKIFSVSSEVEQ